MVPSPNQVLTHAARAARAKGLGQGKVVPTVDDDENLNIQATMSILISNTTERSLNK